MSDQPTGGTQAQLSPFIALKHRDFVLLLLGRFVNTLGRQVQTVAIILQIYQLTKDPQQLGLLALFRVVPVIAFSLAGGVLADAIDRRRLLLITQPILLVCSAFLAVITALGQVSVPAIYAITFVSAAAGALDMPARQALIPTLVPRIHLPNALSWNITAMEVATIAGPALGGIVVARAGFAWAYGIDAASFLAVIAALLLMHIRPGAAASRETRGWRAALAGLRFIRQNPIIMAVMGLDFGATFWGSATVLLPVIADQVLHVDEAGVGTLLSAPAIGALLGAGGMTLISNRIRKPGLPLLLAVVGYGLATVGFGASKTFWIAFLFLAGTGLMDTVSMTLRHQILQLLTPDSLRGRVTAANQVFVQGGPQLGQFEAGTLARYTSSSFSIISGGVACVLTVVVIGLLVPAIRRYEIRHERLEPASTS